MLIFILLWFFCIITIKYITINIGEVLDVEIIKSNFETMLLNNAENEEMMSIDDETDYDDEVKKDGSIDIGEISSQYLALELF